MKEIGYFVLQGLVVAFILGAIGLKIDQGLWWVGCFALNGFGVYAYNKFKK